MSLKDFRIPADPADQQTTEAKSAVPPVEFSVVPGASVNVIKIQDRQGVQNRLATTAYRTYFLPQAYAPRSNGTSVLKATSIRKAGQKVASLVAETQAPGFGSTLKIEDSVNVGLGGYYFCVAVNRAQVEAPCEHMVFVGGASPAATSGGGGGVVPFVPTLHHISTAAAEITGTIDGVNTAFTSSVDSTTTVGPRLIIVDGIFDWGASWAAFAVTTSTGPISQVDILYYA